MKCSHCEQPVEDHSAYCPHCGEALGHKFCAHCGGTMEHKESNATAFVATLIVLFGFGLLILQFVNPKEGETAPKTSVPNSITTQKQYAIISAVETTFADHTLHTVQARVSPYAQEAGILITVQDVTREKLLADPAAIVDLRVYTTDQYQQDPDSWAAHAIAVDTTKNPDYQVPEGFDSAGDRVFIQWR